MTFSEHVKTYRRRYFLGLAVVASAAAGVSVATDKPSKVLAATGAATLGAVAYSALLWPSTKRVATDAAAEHVTNTLVGIGQNLIK